MCVNENYIIAICIMFLNCVKAGETEYTICYLAIVTCCINQVATKKKKNRKEVPLIYNPSYHFISCILFVTTASAAALPPP